MTQPNHITSDSPAQVTTLLDQALSLAARHWAVFPCREKNQGTKKVKSPYTTHGKDEATTDPATITSWWKRWPSALIGIYCENSGFFAVDIDTKNGVDGYASWQELIDTAGEGKPFPVGPMQTTPSGGMHLLFRLPQDLKIPNNAKKLGPGLDLRSNGYICTGSGYAWTVDHGTEQPIPDAPEWLLDCIRAMSPPKETTSQPIPLRQQPPQRVDARQYWLNKYLGEATVGSRNETGYKLASQLHHSGVPQSEAEDTMREYARCVPQNGHEPYTEDEALKSCRSAYNLPAREPAHLPGEHSNGNGYHPAELQELEVDETWPNDEQEPTTQPPSDYLPDDNIVEALKTNEAGDAELLAELYKDRLIYDHAAGEWAFFAGHYWEPDRTGKVYKIVSNEIAPQYLHAAANAQRAGKDEQAGDLVKRAGALRTRKRIENVLYLAARPTLGITGDEWDQDPWTLAVGNGIIDLRTGVCREGRPTDYIRSHTPTEWHGLDAPAPRWERFLQELFSDQPQVPPFLHRMFGYMLTGLTVEHILPIFHGEDGRNGKGTMLEVLGDVLGPDLTTSSQADALMDTHDSGNSPKPFVYGLRGKRLVWASESNEGRRINAGLVKQLTGGDRLNVRTLHSKPVEFHPTHKIVLLTNHRPRIDADDGALWERVFLVEFNQRFIANPQKPNEHQRDLHLKETLLAEAPGILAWLVRGCLAWQKDSLKPPQAVLAATTKYREEEDDLGRFIADRCVVHADAKVKAREIYKAYYEWSTESGQRPMSETAFGRRMKKRFDSTESHTRWYLGVGLELES